MSNQSGSSHLRVLFQIALEDYKKQTGTELAQHPLAERLQDCNSIASVTDILEEAKGFNKFQEKDKVLKPLKKVLTVLHRLSSAADFAQHFGLVCPWAPTGLFNVSDPHPTAFPARESNTDWPWHSVFCMYIYLVSERASL